MYFQSHRGLWHGAVVSGALQCFSIRAGSLSSHFQKKQGPYQCVILILKGTANIFFQNRGATKNKPIWWNSVIEFPKKADPIAIFYWGSDKTPLSGTKSHISWNAKLVKIYHSPSFQMRTRTSSAFMLCSLMDNGDPLSCGRKKCFENPCPLSFASPGPGKRPKPLDRCNRAFDWAKCFVYIT